MSGVQHTPGPWRVGDLNRNGERVVLAEHIEICTCWHHCVSSIEAEMEINARLIAAAPEMYETLLTIADFAVGHGDVCEIIAERARAAIQKATGGAT